MYCERGICKQASNLKFAESSLLYYAGKQPRGMFAIENYHAQMAFHLRKDSRRDCCFELTSPGKRTYEVGVSAQMARVSSQGILLSAS